MSKKKKKLSLKVVTKSLSIVIIAAAILMLSNVGKEVFKTLSLKQQKAAAEEELEKLKEENATLTQTKTKLEDPNYVTTYAKGEYMFSSEGEKVFYLPADD